MHHYCEMEVQGRLALPCGDRASVRVEGGWFCQHHADALAQAQERWSGVNWFPIGYTEPGEQFDPNDPDGRFWDAEDED